jgi:hypothetical protein
MAAGKLGYLPAAMWRTDLIGYVFWVLPAAIQTAMAATIWRRRQVRLMPWFFAFLCEEIIAAFATSIAYVACAGETYFYLFWMFRTIGFLFGLGAIYEIFLSVFTSFDGLRRLSVVLSRGIAAALVLVAVASAAAAPGKENTRLFAALVVLERSVRLVQVGLLLFMFLLSSFFGLAWKNRVFGVALGLAIVTSLQLAASAMRSRYGIEGHLWFELLYGLGPTGGYAASLFYVAKPTGDVVWGRLPVTELEDWNRSVAGLLNR